MRKVRFTRYLLVVFLVGSLALVGFVLFRARHASADNTFDIENVRGRYVSSEIFYDTSSVHAFAAPNGSLVGGPIYLASAEVLVSDGEGNVCGEIDGFGAYPPGPGFNTGPQFYHGTYTVDANGRVAITTCPDAGTPTAICTVAGGFGTACPAAAEPPAPGSNTRLQVGYIQGEHGNEIVTVSQFEAGFPDSTGFVVHTRNWSKASQEGDHHRN
jgi:hypothetical protein